MTEDGPAPPALGVKVNVASTPALPAMRLPEATENVTEATAPPITPELIADDAIGSALVAMVMPVALPAVAAPMVRPVTMTVTAVLAATE